METTPMNILEKFNRWLSESIMVKMASIGFLILILLIPSAWIETLIREREGRADSVVDEIASKWSGPQTLNGPVLIVPFIVHYEVELENKKVTRERIEKAHFLPDNLNVKGSVKPQVLHRGIFDAAVYESAIALKATFNKPDFENMKVMDSDVLWDEAEIAIGIMDLRGIADNPSLLVGGKPCTGEPSSNISFTGRKSDTDNIEGTGVIVKLPWKSVEDFNGDVSMSLSLKGSSSLYFSPVGKTTDVELSGPWASPSFEGEYLPATRSVDEKGFSAAWKVLHYNRPFAQSWIGSEKNLSGYDFGARLLIPVDQYQKSMRTSKYGVLIIMLTFVALFMVEIMKKVRIHPFQYILIGSALIIYYSLLLSFSEQVGYNWAYLIATLATVALIGLYSFTFLKGRILVMVFTALLAFFYGFIFVIIQLQDFSLLIGSIGLFLIVGTIMYFSRGIKWYNEAGS
jgi:inner membrane protein